MTMIDEKIVKIFNKLINGSYYLKEVNHGQYLFNINDIEIKLAIFKKSSKASTSNNAISLEYQENRCWDWDILPHDIEGYTFYLCINDRQYVVPPMSRSEEATALDKLEQMLQFWELKTLNKIINDNSDRF